MDTSKWSQILAYVFALIGFVFWLTEAKWAQPKLSRLKKTAIITGGIIWGLGMVVLAVVTYKGITQHEKAPRFVFFLNSLPLTNKECITFSTTNDSVQLEFSVLNVGEVEAEGLKLWACFPPALNIIPSGTWHEGARGRDRVFGVSADASALMPINDMAIFVPLTVQCSNLNRTVNFLSVGLNAKHNIRSEVSYILHVTNGVGRPYIGF